MGRLTVPVVGETGTGSNDGCTGHGQRVGAGRGWGIPTYRCYAGFSLQHSSKWTLFRKGSGWVGFPCGRGRQGGEQLIGGGTGHGAARRGRAGVGYSNVDITLGFYCSSPRNEHCSGR